MSDVQTFERIAFPAVGTAASSQVREQAETRGHAAGYAAGLRAAHAEQAVLTARLEAEHAAQVAAFEAAAATRLAALDAAVAAVQARTAPVIADAQGTLLESSMLLAEAVVGYEIRASRPAASGAVGSVGLEARGTSGARATLERVLAVVDAGVVVAVRMHPADADALDGVDLPVRVVADAALALGDAVADLPDGFLDATVSGALDRARTALGLGSAE